MAVDWHALGQALKAEHPDPFFREATARILEQVERLGPTRPPADEFRRVYKFLHYNEPSRIERVIKELGTRTRRSRARLEIRADAWAYVAAAFDEWINHARILYLVIGILEGTLRSRIDAHLTQRFGPKWPLDERAAPDVVRDQAKAGRRDQQIRDIRMLLDGCPEATTDPGKASDVLHRIQEILAVKPSDDDKYHYGAIFVTTLDLGKTQSLLASRAHWGGKAQLQDLLKDRETGKSPRREEVNTLLGKLRTVRNDVAHYRPGEELSFAQAFFSTVRLAEWLDVKLQHMYSSIDTRHTTELSRLLGQFLDDLVANAGCVAEACEAQECPISEPVDWLMDVAPRDADTKLTNKMTRACLYHRVQIRENFHRPNKHA